MTTCWKSEGGGIIGNWSESPISSVIAIEGVFGEVIGDERNDCGGVNNGIGEQAETAFDAFTTVFNSSLISGRVGGGDEGVVADVVIVELVALLFDCT